MALKTITMEPQTWSPSCHLGHRVEQRYRKTECPSKDASVQQNVKAEFVDVYKITYTTYSKGFQCTNCNIINSQSCLDIGQNQHYLADIALEEAVMGNRPRE